MNILSLPKYSYEGPSSRYRFYNYKAYFEEHGFQVTIKPLFDKSYFTSKTKPEKILTALKSYIERVFIVFRLILSPKKYDIVLLEYELLPYFPAIFEKILHMRGVKYIVDYDDAIFHKYDISQNIMIRLLLKEKIPSVIKNATYCIACNKYLEDYIKKYNTNIYRLPTVVLLDNYQKAIEAYQTKDSDKFIVGWIGSRTTSVYILELLDVFEALIEKYPNIEFNLVGFDKSLLSKDEIERYHLNIIQWTEKEEIKNILDFDIGVMPLSDDPWSKGKCGFKLIQYMSCKKPVVASPVGINRHIVENDTNGYIASSSEEWLEAIEKLYADDSLRKQMSENNFQKILEEFNFEKNCERYKSLLDKVL